MFPPPTLRLFSTLQRTPSFILLPTSFHATRVGLCSKRYMSVRPQQKIEKIPGRKKVTINRLHQLKRAGTPITMLTAYDYPSGLRSEKCDIDICLVGDSLAQVALGYESTTQITLDEMIHHTRAVARAVRTPFLVTDMPFGSYHSGLDDSVRNAVRMIQEGRCEGVKLEGGSPLTVQIVQRLVEVGIPVMAHVGLTPQRHTELSGYRVQARDAETALQVLRSAEALERAGAFSIVLEAVPHFVAKKITERLSIPTIGIGAGNGCDGQVLVQDDALGVWSGHKAKFVRRFAKLGEEGLAGVGRYASAVRDRSFPDNESEGYEMEEGEKERLLSML